MSSNRQGPSQFRVEDPALKVFPKHIASLLEFLPRSNAAGLGGDLSTQLKSFEKQINAIAQALSDNPRCFQVFLWQQTRDNGLTLALLKAMGYTMTLDTDGTTISALISCIKPILETGIEGGHILNPQKPSERDAEIICATAQVVPRVIRVYWSQLCSRVCSSGTLSREKLTLLENLVTLGFLASQLMRRGRVLDAQVPSAELVAVRKLESGMKNSEAVGDLLLRVIFHWNKSQQLTMEAVVALGGIFGFDHPPLMDFPECPDYLWATLRDSLVSNLTAARFNSIHYFSTVRMIYTILSSPQYGDHFQVVGSMQEGTSPCQSAAIEQKELCDAISEGYWKWLRDKENLLTEEETLKFSIQALISTCYLPLKTSIPSVPHFQTTFAPFAARGLLAWQVLGDNAVGNVSGPANSDWKTNVQHKLEWVGKAANVERNLQSPSPEPPSEPMYSIGFTETLDILRDARGVSSDPSGATDMPISIWKDFSGISQLEEQGYRQRLHAEKSRQFGGRVGCAWARCPLYETKTFREDYWVCCRCGRTPYCGQFCATSDWSRHRSKCRSLSNGDSSGGQVSPTI